MEDQTLHHFMQDLTPIVVMVVLIIAIAWIINTVIIALKQRANMRTRSELYSRLLDKFGSSAEFVAYLQSETGQQIFEELTTRSASPRNKILGSIQKGVILALLGAGLVILGNIFGGSLGGDLYIVLTVSGTIALMLGIGFLISSAISYRLSKSWGLLEIEQKAANAAQASVE